MSRTRTTISSSWKGRAVRVVVAGCVGKELARGIRLEQFKAASSSGGGGPPPPSSSSSSPSSSSNGEHYAPGGGAQTPGTTLAGGDGRGNPEQASPATPGSTEGQAEEAPPGTPRRVAPVEQAQDSPVAGRAPPRGPFTPQRGAGSPLRPPRGPFTPQRGAGSPSHQFSISTPPPHALPRATSSGSGLPIDSDTPSPGARRNLEEHPGVPVGGGMIFGNDPFVDMWQAGKAAPKAPPVPPPAPEVPPLDQILAVFGEGVPDAKAPAGAAGPAEAEPDLPAAQAQGKQAPVELVGLVEEVAQKREQ
ncbi:unnamed protein product [Amoebophrya sp. A25]|nr:unnamed protein product [Amoebophrya sp. A25]|eukprot:GSA25T00020780001.1